MTKPIGTITLDAAAKMTGVARSTIHAATQDDGLKLEPAPLKRWAVDRAWQRRERARKRAKRAARLYRQADALLKKAEAIELEGEDS